MKTREVLGSDLPLLEAIDRSEVPEPPLLNQQMWLRWRKEQGKRPTKRDTGETGTTMAEEMALWKAAMAKYHGGDWKEKLLNDEPRDEDEEEEESLPGLTTLEVFRRPKEARETVAEHDARRLRAGKILLNEEPYLLSESDKEMVSILEELEGRDEKSVREAL